VPRGAFEEASYVWPAHSHLGAGFYKPVSGEALVSQVRLLGDPVEGHVDNMPLTPGHDFYTTRGESDQAN